MLHPLCCWQQQEWARQHRLPMIGNRWCSGVHGSSWRLSGLSGRRRLGVRARVAHLRLDGADLAHAATSPAAVQRLQRLAAWRRLR